MTQASAQNSYFDVDLVFSVSHKISGGRIKSGKGGITHASKETGEYIIKPSQVDADDLYLYRTQVKKVVDAVCSGPTSTWVSP